MVHMVDRKCKFGVIYSGKIKTSFFFDNKENAMKFKLVWG